MSLQKTLESYKGQTFSEPLEAETWIYKQAIKDLMERAKMSKFASSLGSVAVKEFLAVSDLEKAAEDLIKEG
jgi:hypothetical protein